MVKVVIADDEYFILKELEDIIEWQRYGCEIVGIAKNGKEAKELVIEKEADLLITDIKMPFMDGLHVIADLCELQITCDYILISGFSDFSYALKGIKFGVSDYLLKPIEEEELSKAVLKVVKRQEKLLLSPDESLNLDMYTMNNRFIKKAYEYVEKNYASPFSLQDVADHLGISQSYLSKLFVYKVKMRFTQFVNLYRIRISEQYLKATDKTIEEIAFLVGFNDYKYYSQVFKQITGMTPKQYKQETNLFINY